MKGSLRFHLLLSLFFLLIYLPSFASPLPQVLDVHNGLFFRNTEVIIDGDGKPTVGPGDVFWGVFKLNEIIAPTDIFGQTGSAIWPPAPPAEITGYFAAKVVKVLSPGEGPSHTFSTIIFGPTTTDPNNILASGEVFRFFEDSNENYNDSSQGSALATATDGELIWSLGLGPSIDGSSSGGYWYSLADVNIPGIGNIGVSYAGLNVIISNQNIDFGLTNDPNEDYSSDAGIMGGLDVQLWFNSEIFRLPNNPTLSLDPNDPMHFGSNDPAVYFPKSPSGELACRVTAGGNDSSGVAEDGLNWDGTMAQVKIVGQAAKTFNSYQFGGQAGANTGQQPQPKGEWTHHQQNGPDGTFTFHAGTASAPIGTEIDLIRCSDPGYCNPARPAPAKQIDFEGVGTFKNIKNPSAALMDAIPGVTFHWFEVHMEDAGERGNSGQKSDPDQNFCPPEGADGLNGIFIDCDCTDYYRITIYKGFSPSTEPPNKTDFIYEVYGYIDGGNIQIHPQTGFDLK